MSQNLCAEVEELFWTKTSRLGSLSNMRSSPTSVTGAVWCLMMRECEKWLAGKGSNTQAKQEYGAWLRAIPFNPGKSLYTTVSSLGDGLGGVTTQTSENKNRAKEKSLLVTSQGKPALVQFSNAQSNVDLPQASHMDTADFMEDLVQISRLRYLQLNG